MKLTTGVLISRIQKKTKLRAELCVAEPNMELRKCAGTSGTGLRRTHTATAAMLKTSRADLILV
jgi:hypothetical protein